MVRDDVWMVQSLQQANLMKLRPLMRKDYDTRTKQLTSRNMLNKYE